MQILCLKAGVGSAHCTRTRETPAMAGTNSGRGDPTPLQAPACTLSRRLGIDRCASNELRFFQIFFPTDWMDKMLGDRYL